MTECQKGQNAALLKNGQEYVAAAKATGLPVNTGKVYCQCHHLIKQIYILSIDFNVTKP